MDRTQLLEHVYNNVFVEDNEDVFEKDCENIEFILDNCEITIAKNNYFFVETNGCELQHKVYCERANELRKQMNNVKTQIGVSVRAYTGIFDFSHTCPYWEDIIENGLYGLRQRILENLQNPKNSKEANRFFNGCKKVYDASIRFLKRASEVARLEDKIQMADGLLFLSENKPQTFYHRLQMFLVFYTLEHFIEGTYLRTLGRLDSLLYPYYLKENKESANDLIEKFISEIDRLNAPANIPFALGGDNENRESLVSELTYKILEVYGKLNTCNTKMHILCNDKTPDDLLKRAFELVRAGKNSICFISDDVAIESLEKLGAERKDAYRYHVVGCYECGAEGEIASTCNARVNLPKALEVLLNNGEDVFTGTKLVEVNTQEIDSFDTLLKEFKKIILEFSDRAMTATNFWEKNYCKIHASPFLSSTYPSSIEKGGDLYCSYTAKYNNSSLNALGLATAVDSLAAIRQLVFEEKKYTLLEFANILKSNWENQEVLRLQIKNNYPKYGVGDARTDDLARQIIESLSSFINRKANVKGGVWRLGTFSIDWRWEFGSYTHATADGRKAGETLSQNTSATFSIDKQGATGHLLSATSFPHTLTPNSSVVDLDIHISAVRGENGLDALVSTLKTYFQRKGLAVHYNILDTEVLKQAKINPSQYPNLQVRLCGWNVLFSSLSEKEKDEFIKRAIIEEN